MADRLPVGRRLAILGALTRTWMDARLDGCEVTPVQAHVLLRLCSGEGEMSQGELVEYLKVRPSTANGILRRMEEKGLVRRRVPEEDGRKRTVVLTDRGDRCRARIRGAIEEAEALLVEGISPEDRAVLDRCLDAMMANLRRVSAC